MTILLHEHGCSQRNPTGRTSRRTPRGHRRSSSRSERCRRSCASSCSIHLHPYHRKPFAKPPELSCGCKQCVESASNGNACSRDMDRQFRLKNYGKPILRSPEADCNSRIKYITKFAAQESSGGGMKNAGTQGYKTQGSSVTKLLHEHGCSQRNPTGRTSRRTPRGHRRASPRSERRRRSCASHCRG